jgi:peptide/nickel transport system substrate-binding protein
MPKLRWFAALSAALVLATAPCAAVTLRYSGTTAPLTMDPHATNDFVTTALVRQVYDSVVALENNMELGPASPPNGATRGRTPGASSCARA